MLSDHVTTSSNVTPGPAAAAAAASQQSHPSNKPLNGRVTPPFGASSSVSVAHLFYKSVGRILDRKNRPIGDERILDVSSDFVAWKNSGCKGCKHTCLTLTDSEEWAAPLLYEAAMTRAQKEGEGYALRMGLQHPMLTSFFFAIPRCPERERTGNKISKVIGLKTIIKKHQQKIGLSSLF